MLILPLITLYATACEWHTASASLPNGLVWLLVASFFSGLVIEIGRKIRAPEDEEPGVETYSPLGAPDGDAGVVGRYVPGCGQFPAGRPTDRHSGRPERPVRPRPGGGRDRGVAVPRSADTGAGQTVRTDLRILDPIVYLGSGSVLTAPKGGAGMRYIVHPGESSAVDRLGGKAAALAVLHRSGASIPAWFVLTAEAFDASLGARDATPWPLPLHLTSRRNSPWGLSRAANCQKRWSGSARTGEPVAVRSSAADEDGAQHSFAGQFESFLFVPPAQVPNAAEAVWQSAFSERLLATAARTDCRRRAGRPRSWSSE